MPHLRVRLKVVFRPVQAELLLQSLGLSRRLQGVVLCFGIMIFTMVLRK